MPGQVNEITAPRVRKVGMSRLWRDPALPDRPRNDRRLRRF